MTSDRWIRPAILGLVVLAACSRAPVEPECDSNPGFVGSALTCDAAVTAAIDALPGDHPPVQRIQFLYGSPIPTTGGVLRPDGEEEPVHGYVAFTYADATPRQYVLVTWFEGELTTGVPADY